MKYTVQLCLLTDQFLQDYPSSCFPELLLKQKRPYVSLLLEMHDYFICIPFRTSIKHENAFLFKTSRRSQKNHSGLDYSKLVIIRDKRYIDLKTKVVVDHDEYVETLQNLPKIINEVGDYIRDYMNHIQGIHLMNSLEFNRKYQYSTLPYFLNILNCYFSSPLP